LEPAILMVGNFASGKVLCQNSWFLGKLGLTKGGGSFGLTGLGKIAGIGGLSGLAGLLAAQEAEDEDDIDITDIDRGEGIKFCRYNCTCKKK
jgi:hypothetical protein